jgi:hypothetical protein
VPQSPGDIVQLLASAGPCPHRRLHGGKEFFGKGRRKAMTGHDLDLASIKVVWRAPWESPTHAEAHEVSAYCTCGAALHGSGETLTEAVRQMEEAYDRHRAGAGDPASGTTE